MLKAGAIPRCRNGLAFGGSDPGGQLGWDHGAIAPSGGAKRAIHMEHAMEAAGYTAGIRRAVLALVTGGAGFIGSHVVRLLASRGVRVRVLDDLSTGFEENLADVQVEFVRGDIRDEYTVDAAVSGADLVFHLAASVGNARSQLTPRRDAEVNAVGTAVVLEAARKAGVHRFVHSSSAAVFGELVTMPIAEDHPQNPDSPYGVSKLAAEKYVLCFGRLYGMGVVCLRYFNVYGTNQRYDAYGNVIPIFAEQLAAGCPLTIYGDGEQTRDFVNVRDVALANYLAAVREASGVYNIGSGTSITINDLVRLVTSASSAGSRPVVHMPPRAGEVRHCRADVTKAVAELGYQAATSLEQGVGDYLRWFETARHGPVSLGAQRTGEAAGGAGCGADLAMPGVSPG